MSPQKGPALGAYTEGAAPASPWAPIREDHQQTRAAISQLAGLATHGTVPEDADL